jgi:hypothetical protein
MRIGRATEFVFAAAKHLRVRFQLAMDFKANHDFVIGSGEGGGGCHKAMYYQSVVPSLSRDQFDVSLIG